MTEDQIAANMGISIRTLTEWKQRFTSIVSSLKKGKAPVDQQVENALFKRAIGYDYEEITEEIETLKDGSTKKHIRKVKKHVPGDVLAMFFWLKNRRPDKWRDKPVDQGDTATMEKLDAMLAEVRNHAANA